MKFVKVIGILLFLLSSCTTLQNTDTITWTLDSSIKESTVEDFKEFIDYYKGSDYKTIIINLNSPGGGVIAGQRLIDQIDAQRILGKHIITFVDDGNRCYSMCTVVFAVGDERIAHKNSWWMFHGPWIAEMGVDPAHDTSLPPQERLRRKQMIILSQNITYNNLKRADKAFADMLLREYLLTMGEKQLWLRGKILAKRTTTYFTRLISD